jgi:ABC-2 type transport system permease protein
VPIYDQSYRPYRGAFSSHATRWWTIARTGVVQLLSKRVFLIIALAITVGPILVGGSIIWANHRFPEQRLFPTDAEFFRKLMEFQSIWFLVLGIYPGTGLISNDLKGNAIQLYLSKPLTKLDYVAGKFAILATFTLGVTLVPGLGLFALELGFSSDLKFISAFWWVPLGIAAYAALTSLTWGLIVLGLSSMSKNSRYVGILLISLSLFSGAVATIASGIFNSSSLIVLSVSEDLKLLTYLFLGGHSEWGDHAFGAAFILLALAAGAAMILRSKVRAVEVVT